MLVLDSRAKVAGSALFYFLCALALSAYSARNPEVVSDGAALVSEGLRPFRTVTSGVSNSVKTLYSTYLELVGVKAANQELTQRVQTLEAANSRLLEIESENQRLRELLGVGERTRLKGAIAQVVGRDATNWVQTVTLNRGTSDGISRGMPVLVGDGVVGHVVSASPSTAIVLLMTDHSSGIDAIVQGSRAQGVVEGTGKEVCRWRFVLRDAAVNIGDRVITSGLDGIYPKGLLLGVVTEIGEDGGLFRSISIRPAVELSSIEDVFVVTTPAPVRALKREVQK